MDYLRLILRDFFINFTPNSISLSLTPSFLLIFKLFISAIMFYKVYLYLLFIAVVSVAVVLSIISNIFMAASWADFVVDFRKVFLTLLVIFMVVLKVAFISVIMKLPAIVIGYIVVSSLFFRDSLAPLISSSNFYL